MELFPFVSFKNNGYYFEGDFAREKTPKLLLSGAFHQNNRAVRTQGQLGNELFAPKTIRSIFFDGLLKYNGWSFMTAYMQRHANNLVAYNPLDLSEFNYVYGGYGLDYQLSYVFTTNYELIGRFSTQNVHQQIQTLAPNSKQYSLGVTKYIWEHAFKLQTELTYNTLDYFSSNNKNNWYLRFQIEMGI